MLILGEVLVIITNNLLDVSPFMMILSTITMFFAVFGLVSIGIGLGAMYPKFRYENIAQVATGFGGLVYMIISALFMASVIVLESYPVYVFFMADLRNRAITPYQWIMISVSFLLVVIILALAIYKPMKMGMESLINYE